MEKHLLNTFGKKMPPKKKKQLNESPVVIANCQKVC